MLMRTVQTNRINKQKYFMEGQLKRKAFCQTCLTRIRSHLLSLGHWFSRWCNEQKGQRKSSLSVKTKATTGKREKAKNAALVSNWCSIQSASLLIWSLEFSANINRHNNWFASDALILEVILCNLKKTDWSYLVLFGSFPGNGAIITHTICLAAVPEPRLTLMLQPTPTWLLRWVNA